MPIRLIGLTVVLALSLTLAPLAAEAQSAGKVYRIVNEVGDAVEHQH